MAGLGDAGAGADDDAGVDDDAEEDEGETAEFDDLEYLEIYGASRRSRCFSGSWSRKPWHISILLVSSQVLPKFFRFAITLPNELSISQ